MKTIKRNQVLKKIREVLPSEHAVKFLSNRHYLMVIAAGQESTIALDRLKTAYNGDDTLINKMVQIYIQLANTFAMFHERVSNIKTVSGEKSLLGYLTDGESHFRVYPNVNFNQ